MWVRAWSQYLVGVAVGERYLRAFGALGKVTLRNIAPRSNGAQHALLWIADDPKGEFDIEFAAMLVRGPRRQRMSTRLDVSQRDRLAVSAPMRRTEVFGDNQIQAPADRFACRVAEERLRSRIPQFDRAFAVGEDQGVRSLLNDCAA